MNEDTLDHLYRARWAVTKTIETGDHSPLDHAMDSIIQAKANLITEDVEEPERPDKTQDDVKVIEEFEMPTIVELVGVEYKKRGHFRTPSAMAKGVLIHYTVSGRTAKSAKGVVNYLARKGLGCPVMDEYGIIYVPKGFDIFRDVAYHAGASSWQGRTGISAFCIGMEICCWGTDSRGDDRRVSSGEANIKKGSYQKFLPAQEKSLTNFIRLVKMRCPDFDLEWVVGHDEVAPTRKSDPGASLSMTMPEYREKLAEIL